MCAEDGVGFGAAANSRRSAEQQRQDQGDESSHVTATRISGTWATKPALVGVGEAVGHLGERDPGDLGDLRVGVGKDSAGRQQQVVVHGLVDPPVSGRWGMTGMTRGEPVVDGAQGSDDPAADAGLLLHLAHRRLLDRLRAFDVSFGQ